MRQPQKAAAGRLVRPHEGPGREPAPRFARQMPRGPAAARLRSEAAQKAALRNSPTEKAPTFPKKGWAVPSFAVKAWREAKPHHTRVYIRKNYRRAAFCFATRPLYYVSAAAQPIRPAPLLMAMNSGAKTRETTVISLIRMLMDGPEVSLNGSPTVSPTTAALWLSLPLPP